LWSFYETVPTKVGPTDMIIVDKASATLYHDKEQYAFLNTNHRNICKFDEQTNTDYRTLRNAFGITIETILSEDNTIASKTNQDAC